MSIEGAIFPMGNRPIDKKPALNTYESSNLLMNMGVDVRKAALPMAVGGADMHEHGVS